jgi:hypothetical protein
MARDFVFGVVEPLPLHGWPSDNVRLSFREGQFAVGFVVGPEKGVFRKYYVKEVMGTFEPVLLCGMNIRKMKSTRETT